MDKMEKVLLCIFHNKKKILQNKQTKILWKMLNLHYKKIVDN